MVATTTDNGCEVVPDLDGRLLRRIARTAVHQRFRSKAELFGELLRVSGS